MKALNVLNFRNVAALIATLVLGNAASAADQWVLDLSKGSGAVGFHAIGKPKMLKIHGQGGAPKGQLAVTDGKVSGKAIFDLRSLKTGIDMRDSHMKEK